MVGTRAYMSPEQALGQETLDERSDLYSLASVLYETLTGEALIGAATTQVKIASERSKAPAPSLRNLVSETPLAIEEALTRALAPNPAERFASCEEFAAALVRGGRSGEQRNERLGEQSIAVLPFENLSADVENEYFSDGVTEDIIAQLSRIGGLKVISRTSVARYKTQRKSAREIVDELGVTHLLEGTVRKAGARLRIVAQLIDARSDRQLWVETFDRDLTDVFAIQSDVAERIAGSLQPHLARGEREKLRREPTTNLEAHNLLLLARHYWNRQTGFEDWARAAGLVEQALALDAEYAPAWAFLAGVKGFRASYEHHRAVEHYREALDAARRAVALDDTLPEGHAILGMWSFWFEYQWETATHELATAVRLGPGSAEAHGYYALVLTALGRHGEAVASNRRAVELAPLDMTTRLNASIGLYRARRFEEAQAWFAQARAIEPSHAMPFVGALPLIQLARFDEARDVLERCSTGMAPFPQLLMAYLFAMWKRPELAQEILAEVERDNPVRPVWTFGLAMVQTALGNLEQALGLLERGYEDRVGWMAWLAVEPALDPLRSEVRFQSLLKRMGLEASRVTA